LRPLLILDSQGSGIGEKKKTRKPNGSPRKKAYYLHSSVALHPKAPAFGNQKKGELDERVSEEAKPLSQNYKKTRGGASEIGYHAEIFEGKLQGQQQSRKT